MERLVVVVDPTTGKRTEHRLDDVDDLPAATRRAIRATGPAPAAPRWGAGAMSAPTLAELVAAEVAAELERRRRDLALMRRTGWGYLVAAVVVGTYWGVWGPSPLLALVPPLVCLGAWWLSMRAGARR